MIFSSKFKKIAFIYHYKKFYREPRNAKKNHVPERAENGTRYRNSVPEQAERGFKNQIGVRKGGTWNPKEKL